jgi:hypothetical protein
MKAVQLPRNVKIASAESAGRHQRHGDAPPDRELVQAVDARRLDESPSARLEELLIRKVRGGHHAGNMMPQ